MQASQTYVHFTKKRMQSLLAREGKKKKKKKKEQILIVETQKKKLNSSTHLHLRLFEKRVSD